MDFVLFLMLNAIVLIRPEDFLPDIAGARLYLIVIMLNVVVALPKIVDRLQTWRLVNRPITVCVLGLLVASALSLLVRFQIDDAFDFVSEFAKTIVYFLLLLAVVDTPTRLRTFLGFVVLLVVVVAGLGVLQMHEVIDYEALRPFLQGMGTDPETGEAIYSLRLCGPGIFNDPNDMCLVLTFGIICSLYRGMSARNLFVAALWVMPIWLFGYAIVLTQSRGGLLGLLGALASVFVGKYGIRRALPFVVVGVPLALIAVGGRQGGVTTGDTAHERMMLWAEGLGELFRNPLYIMTGIGADQYREVLGMVAHNSFVHAYVELGLLGGSLFVVPFVLAIRMLYILRRATEVDVSPQVAAMRPFILAMVVGYCGGMYSLSRNYIVPTYICLGIAETYLTMAMRHPRPEFRLTRVWGKQTILIGVGTLIFLKFFTQYFGSLVF